MKVFWLINLCLFQLSWFSAALLTEYAAVIICVLLVVHLLLSPSMHADIRVLLLLPFGLLADGMQILFGSFSGTELAFPFWLVALWAMLLLSLNHSLKWLAKIPLAWLAPVGAICGASSYWAGIQFGALQTHWSVAAFLGSTALVWSVLLPVLVISRQRLLHVSPSV